MPERALTHLERDALMYGGGRLLAGLGGLLLIPLLAQSMGPGDYGRYAYLLALTMMVAQLSSGWLNQAIIRFYPGSSPGLLRASVRRLRWIAGMLGFMGVLVMALIAGEALTVALAMGSFVLVWAWYTTYIAYQHAELQALRVNLAENLRVYLPLVVVSVWLWFSLPLSVPAALFFVTAGFALSAWILSYGLSPIAKEQPDIARSKELFRYGAPLGVWMSLASLQFFIGRAALHLYGDALNLGLYSALQDLSSKGVGLLFIPLVHALAPRMMQAWSASEPLYTARLYRRGLGLGTTIIVMMLAGAWVFGENLLQLLFGAQHEGLFAGVSAMPLLIVLMVLCEGLGGLALLSHKGYELLEQTTTMVWVSILSILLNVSLLAFFLYLTGGITLWQVILSLMLARMMYVTISLLHTLALFRPVPTIPSAVQSHPKA